MARKNKIETQIEINGQRKKAYMLRDDISIFRYRSCNEYHIDALKNDKLFLSSPNTFNDPYDYSFSFSKVNIDKYLKNKAEEFSKLTKTSFEYNHDYLKYALDELFIDFVKKMRDSYRVACFSESVTEEIMWANYANYGKGFAVEYNITDLRNRNIFENLYEIIPVIYKNKKPLSDLFIYSFIENLMEKMYEKTGCDCPENCKGQSAEMFFNTHENEIGQILLNSLQFKNKVWEFEQEYRMIVFKRDADGDFVCYEGVRPKEIYLGEFIEETNAQTIISIAKEKNIPVNIMKTDYSSGRNMLVPYRLEF